MEADASALVDVPASSLAIELALRGGDCLRIYPGVDAKRCNWFSTPCANDPPAGQRSRIRCLTPTDMMRSFNGLQRDHLQLERGALRRRLSTPLMKKREAYLREIASRWCRRSRRRARCAMR